MAAIEETFRTHDGLDLFVRHWMVPKPQAAVVLVHGVGVHSGRFVTLAEALNRAGFSAHAFDHRGHGRSPGKRGHIAAWSDYRGDLDAFLRYGRVCAGGIPFVLGHSLGALIVLDELLNNPPAVRGAALLASPLQPLAVAPRWKMKLARGLNRWWPSFTLPLGIDPRALTNDPEQARDTLLDPLTHGRVTARWGIEVTAAIERVRQEAGLLRCPLLLLHGAADRIVDPAGTNWLAEHAGSAAKRVIVYDGARHEVQSDFCRRQVEADLLAWLREQSEASVPDQGRTPTGGTLAEPN